MKNLPKMCPNCGKGNWMTSDHPYFLEKAVKGKEDKYDVKTNKGMIIRTYVCKNCSYLVFFKEQYDKDLV
jgi:ribosomal protein S27AE